MEGTRDLAVSPGAAEGDHGGAVCLGPFERVSRKYLSDADAAHHVVARGGAEHATPPDGKRGVMVSPVFERNENKVLGSLVGQVARHDNAHASCAKVWNSRRLEDRNGRCTMIEDNGLSGKGFWSAVKGGDSSLIGCFATDVNNRASRVSIASSSMLCRIAVAREQGAPDLNELHFSPITSEEE